MAEETDKGKIVKLVSRETNLLQACIQNRVPCLHSLCSQNKNRIYTDLEHHFRVAHSRVRFSCEIKKAAAILKDGLHFNELKTSLETLHGNKIKVGLSTEETDLTIPLWGGGGGGGLLQIFLPPSDCLLYNFR